MPIFPSEIQRARKAVETQVKQTDKVIASNEAIAELVSGLDNNLSKMHGTLTSGFSMLGAGLQELYFAVDDGFRELSYKLDLQNETLEAIKEILERPLDTQAKELRKRAEFAYLNGWMDEAEVDLLESEKKNYQDFIALHILGNIYNHHKKNHQKALEYYQKAAKYAAPQSKLDACKALLCAAKVYKELGKAEDAYKSTWLAMDTLSDDAHNLFNHSAYSAMTKHSDESIDCLKRAVLKDPTFLIAADNDERFSNVAQEKEKLKRDLRDEKRKAVELLKDLIGVERQKVNNARNEAQNLGVTDFKLLENDLATLDKRVAEIDKLYANNSYVDLLKAEKVARDLYDKSFKVYERNIDEWIKVKNTVAIGELKSKEGKIKNSLAHVGWGFILAVIAGILAFVVIDSNPDLSKPKKIGPVEVLTVTSPVSLSGKHYGRGSSFEVVNKTNESTCIRFTHGNVECYNRKEILKAAKLETGYVYDRSKMISDGAAFFWVIGFPVIVWIVSAIAIKQTKLSNIRNEIERENNALARLSSLKKKN